MEHLLPVRAAVSIAAEPNGKTLNLSGSRYIEFVAAVERYRPLTQRQATLINLLQFAGELDRPMKSYSHGTLKKLSIISSLNESASVYIFDEIFNGLDIVSLKAMKEFFIDFAKDGKLIIICSHFLQILFSWCDEIILLNNGGISHHWGREDLSKFSGLYEPFEAEAIRYYGEAHDC